MVRQNVQFQTSTQFGRAEDVHSLPRFTSVTFSESSLEEKEEEKEEEEEEKEEDYTAQSYRYLTSKLNCLATSKLTAASSVMPSTSNC